MKTWRRMTITIHITTITIHITITTITIQIRQSGRNL